MQYLVFSDFVFDDDETLIDQLITKRNGVVIAKVPDDMVVMFEGVELLSISKIRPYSLDKPAHSFIKHESIDVGELSDHLELFMQRG